MFSDKKYYGRDINVIREQIAKYVRTNNPDWTDYNLSSLQSQYLDICAGTADMLGYYLDNQANETYLMSARQEKNIRGMLTTLNYKMPFIGSYKGELTIKRPYHQLGLQETEPEYLDGRFFVPKYTRVVTGDTFDTETPEYVTLEDVMIDIDENEVTVPIVQGRHFSINVPISTVRSSFKLYITTKPVPEDYVYIEDESWVRVDDAFIEVDGGQKYSVHTDSHGYVYILFTYDWTKYLSDDANASLKVSYIESVGEDGKVGAHVLTRLVGKDVINYDTGETVDSTLRVDNEASTYGGYSSVDLNLQKANARYQLKTYDRIILLSDAEQMIRQKPWIVDCKVFDWRTNRGLVEYPHMIKAWVTTIDGTDVPDSELQSLTDELQSKCTTMTTIKVYSATYRPLSIQVDLSVIGPDKEIIRREVEDRLNVEYSLAGYINPENNKSLVKFGMKINPVLLNNEIVQISKAIEQCYIYFNGRHVYSSDDTLFYSEIEIPAIPNFVVSLK